MNGLLGGRKAYLGIATLAWLAIAGVAAAQDPPPPVFSPQPTPAPPPVFTSPQPAAAPPVFAPQPAPQPVPQFADPSAQFGGPIESPRVTLKRMFAGTLATLTQTAGSTILLGLTQAITGGLTSWFRDRKSVV